MNNIKNNIPTNIPTIDYYKDLKDIKKVLDEKIYKLLSKDESFSEMLDNIKDNFINSNLTIVEDNLSKPQLTNYKTFNGKIRNILEIIVKLLEYHTDYEYKKDNDEILTTVIKTMKEKMDENNKKLADDYNGNKQAEAPEKKGNESHTERESPESLNTTIKEIVENKVKDDKDVKQEEEKEKRKKILTYIYTLKYYIHLLSTNDMRADYLDNQIKILDTQIADKLKEQTIKTQGNKSGVQTDNTELNIARENLKKIHEEYKKYYKEICSYVRISIYDIFDIVANKEAEMVDKMKKKEEGDKKDKDITKEYEKYIADFKKIYNSVLNNNTSANDDIFALLKDSNNEKIDLEARKKLLAEMKELLDTQLKKLNDTINFLVTSNKQEYLDQIKEIKKVFKDYGKEKEYKDSISSLIVKEENEIVKLIAKNIEQTKSYTERSKLVSSNKQSGGGDKKDNKYYEGKYENIKKLKDNIENLITKIRETEGIEDNDDPFEKKDNVLNMMADPNNGIISIYKSIWNDYIKETKKSKGKGINIENLKQDDRLYHRFIENDLDPSEVLKITFQDKVIFICIILIIRTFSMVLIEFLIEYNIISSLSRGIIVYSILYILLIMLSVLVVNYDSYKLRIIANYLNLHINSSNIYFHILLFLLFNGLVLIIVNNDNGLNNIDNMFNFTYIYKYIYEISEKSKTVSELRLSQKDKIMLQYRMDIITMIIFIFTSLLILIM
jgi:hypothetical protein|uniref:Uncharacterized protein n=1 Tax=viral metagenome TaxID=1070528 RepID=A0A6C0LVX0_9ZZZZ